LFYAECWKSAGERVSPPPSFEQLHQNTTNWMENKAHSQRIVEDETLQSVLAFIMHFENFHSNAPV
jgi:hypothetical protein